MLVSFEDTAIGREEQARVTVSTGAPELIVNVEHIGNREQDAPRDQSRERRDTGFTRVYTGWPRPSRSGMIDDSRRFSNSTAIAADSFAIARTLIQ
jgi:hypothetical protein